MAITRFRDEYFFLSNFYPHELKFHGMTFLNSEAAFQAMKTQDIAEQLRFTLLTPQEAKRLGRRINLRPTGNRSKTALWRPFCGQNSPTWNFATGCWQPETWNSWRGIPMEIPTGASATGGAAICSANFL